MSQLVYAVCRLGPPLLPRGNQCTVAQSGRREPRAETAKVASAKEHPATV